VLLVIFFLSAPLYTASAVEQPTVIEFEMEIDTHLYEYGYSSKDVEEYIRAHNFYVFINRNPVQLNLSGENIRNLARGYKIIKQIEKSTGIPDGTYWYCISHGINGIKSSEHIFTVENGRINYIGASRSGRHLFKVLLNTSPAESPLKSTSELNNNNFTPIWGRSIERTFINEKSDYGDKPIWKDIEQDSKTFWGDVNPDNSMAARIFTSMVQDIIISIWRFFGLHDPVVLFFNVNPADVYSEEYSSMFDEKRLSKTLYVDPDNAFLYMFTNTEYSIITKVFDAFNSFLLIPYVIAIAIVGALILLKGFTAEERSTIKILVGGILLFPFMLKFVPYLFEPLFWLNYTIVRALGSVLLTSDTVKEAAPLTRPFVTILIGSGTGISSLGVVIGTLVLFLMTAILNFQYFVRRFMIALLLMMFPIVAFLQIFPGTRQVFRMWWSEFAANLFLQSAHAMVYVMFIHYIYEAQLLFVPIMAMLVTLSAMTAFVRNLMGCRPGSGISGMAGGMLGISALIAAGRIASGTIGGLFGGTKQYMPETGGAAGHSNRKVALAGSDISDIQGGSGLYPSGVPVGIGPQASVMQASRGEGVMPSENSIDGPGASSEASSVSAESTDLKGDIEAVQKSSESTLYPDYRIGRTGPQWGRKPLVPQADVFRTARKLAATTVLGGGMFLGAMVGGAAMGPAGLGLGAMVGTKAASIGVKAGNYLGGIVENRIATRKIINDIMQKYPDMKQDEKHGYMRATVMAATGVDATFDEIRNDKVMLNQYRNFVDSAGLANFYKTLDSFYASEEQQKMWDITAVAREQYAYNNPTASPQQINNYILNDIIRPAMSSQQQNQQIMQSQQPMAYASEDENAEKTEEQLF